MVITELFLIAIKGSITVQIINFKSQRSSASPIEHFFKKCTSKHTSHTAIIKIHMEEKYCYDWFTSLLTVITAPILWCRVSRTSQIENWFNFQHSCRGGQPKTRWQLMILFCYCYCYYLFDLWGIICYDFALCHKITANAVLKSDDIRASFVALVWSDWKRSLVVVDNRKRCAFSFQ